MRGVECFTPVATSLAHTLFCGPLPLVCLGCGALGPGLSELNTPLPPPSPCFVQSTPGAPSEVDMLRAVSKSAGLEGRLKVLQNDDRAIANRSVCGLSVSQSGNRLAPWNRVRQAPRHLRRIPAPQNPARDSRAEPYLLFRFWSLLCYFRAGFLQQPENVARNFRAVPLSRRDYRSLPQNHGEAALHAVIPVLQYLALAAKFDWAADAEASLII